MKSILQTSKGQCYLCHAHTQTQDHHIFGGANRKNSEKYGLKVYLCPLCHNVGKGAVHNNAEKMLRLRRIGQQAFEQTRTREEFMRIFGRNYLD